MFGPKHHTTGDAINNLAAILRKEQKYPEAEKWQREYFDIEVRTYGPNHPNVGDVLYNHGCLAALQGRSNVAVTFLRQSVARGLDPATAMQIANDTDLASLRMNPQFRALLLSVKASTPTRQNVNGQPQGSSK